MSDADNWLDRYQSFLRAKDYAGALAMLRAPADIERLGDLERYAALGRACEAHGLGWYNEDGEMRFQAPSDVIEDLAFQKGFDAALKNPPKHEPATCPHSDPLRFCAYRPDGLTACPINLTGCMTYAEAQADKAARRG